jgi:hypothetical protein
LARRKKGDELDWGSVRMSPKAREHFEAFQRRYRELREEVNKTPLVVLIWGPGPKGGELFKKRQQIRGRLRKRGDVAVFSEELDRACADFKASARARELLQAQAADFIAVIYGSPGAIAEVHDFGSFLVELGSKMLVFIDSRYRGSYRYAGLLTELKAKFSNVESFEYPKDITECHLVAAVEKRLENLRWAKWWELRRRTL